MIVTDRLLVLDRLLSEGLLSNDIVIAHISPKNPWIEREILSRERRVDFPILKIDLNDPRSFSLSLIPDDVLIYALVASSEARKFLEKLGMFVIYGDVHEEFLAGEVPLASFVQLGPFCTVYHASRSLSDSGAECVVVSLGSKPLGILSAGDLLRTIASGKDPANTRLLEILPDRFLFATPAETLRSCIERMARAGLSMLPVISDNEILGVLTEDVALEYSLQGPRV